MVVGVRNASLNVPSRRTVKKALGAEGSLCGSSFVDTGGEPFCEVADDIRRRRRRFSCLLFN